MNQDQTKKWKSFTTMTFLFCIGLVVTLLFIVLMRSCVEKGKLDGAVSFVVDTQTSTPLRKELYGFNSNMMSGDYGYLDEDFLALTKVLQPKTLRFPGGTVGNFYHWKTQGFIREEMETTLSPQLNKRNRGNFVRLQKRRNGIISFDDFMVLCQEQNITPIIMVNLWTGSPEESADWVRYAKKKGYNVNYWELGNEHYLTHYANKFPTAKFYMREAEKHALAMKAVDPDIKVSVCASPVAFHKEGFVIKTPQRKWDEGLAKQNDPTASSWYDAFSVHVYAYKAMRDVDIEQMRGYLFGWIHHDFDQAMEYYQELFPDKEMWITEWNIANPANRVANTQLHAMYTGDFFLKILNTTKITHANFHVITGPGKGFPVFSRITPASERTFWKYGGEPESDYGNTIRRTVYYTFQLIGDAFSKADTQFTTYSTNTPLIEGHLDYKGQMMDGIQTQAVGSTERLSILVSNRTSDEVLPQIIVDGKRFKKEITYRYVANDKLKATNGGNAELEGSGEIEVRLQEWKGKAKNLTIPKNSFGVIEVRK